MDSLDAKYRLSIAWHKTAKFLTADFETWRDRSILCAASMMITVPFLIADPDNLTNENTAAVQERLQTQFTALAENGGVEQQRGFLQDLLRAEDLSEKQTRQMLLDFNERFGDYSNALGYNIGNIGDLRESRAVAGTDDVQKLAAHNLKKSADEEFVTRSTMVLALLMMPLVMMGGIPALRRDAERKPRNPKFKH